MEKSIILKPEVAFDVDILMMAVKYAKGYIDNNLEERMEGQEQGYIIASLVTQDGTCIFKMYHTLTAVICLMDYIPPLPDENLEED